MVPKSDKQIILKIICIAAAFFLWLYINIMEMPVRTVKFRNVPVYIENTDVLDEQKLAVLNPGSYKVTLSLKGNVADIQNISKEQFKLVVDLGSYALRKGTMRMPVQIKSSPNNISIEKSEDLWIDITFDSVVEKNFAVSAKFEGTAKDYIFDFKPIVSPKQVTVTGAETYVNKVSGVVAKCQVNDAEDDITMNVPLAAVDDAGKEVSNVSVNPASAEVFIPVNKTKTVGINIKTKGTASSDINVKSIVPEQYNLLIAGKPDALAKVNSIDTQPIDLSTISDSSELNVKLVNPSGITIVNNNGYIKVKVTVDKLSQKTFTVNIQFKNLDASLTVASDTQQASVTLSGYESILNAVNADNIVCYADMTGLKEGDASAPLSVTPPQNTTFVSASPGSIKVTVKKK